MAQSVESDVVARARTACSSAVEDAARSPESIAAAGAMLRAEELAQRARDDLGRLRAHVAGLLDRPLSI